MRENIAPISLNPSDVPMQISILIKISLRIFTIIKDYYIEDHNKLLRMKINQTMFSIPSLPQNQITHFRIPWLSIQFQIMKSILSMKQCSKMMLENSSKQYKKKLETIRNTTVRKESSKLQQERTKYLKQYGLLKGNSTLIAYQISIKLGFVHIIACNTRELISGKLIHLLFLG